jgi:hypothetical protein
VCMLAAHERMLKCTTRQLLAREGDNFQIIREGYFVACIESCWSIGPSIVRYVTRKQLVQISDTIS